jgi:hypothetical protein
MVDFLPKSTDVFSYHLKKFDIIENLLSSVNIRVEAEDAYEKALLKSVMKVNEMQTDLPLYSMIIKGFKGLSS